MGRGEPLMPLENLGTERREAVLKLGPTPVQPLELLRFPTDLLVGFPQEPLQTEPLGFQGCRLSRLDLTG
jgi:hypothetical protein